MKKIIVLAAASLLSLAPFRVGAMYPPKQGPAVFDLVASSQAYSYLLASVTTNHLGTTTNVTTVYKSKATNAPVNSAVVLNLLENSFNTNFPAGARLVLSGVYSFSFYVLDASGSNILLNATSVLSISNNVAVYNGLETWTHRTSPSTNTYFGNDTEFIRESATLIYDDSSRVTKNTTHTVFSLNGLLLENRSINLRTGNSVSTLTYRATGSGTVLGTPNVVLDGTLTSTIAGVLRL